MQMPDFRRIAWRALLSAAVLVGVAAGLAGAKALPPVSVFWQVDSTDGADGVYGVALTVLARSDFPDLAVELALPAEFEALGGELRWAGPLARDQTHTLQVRVRATAPGTVTAHVSGKTASNVQFSRTVRVDVPEPENRPSEAGKTGPDAPGVSRDESPKIREFPSR